MTKGNNEFIREVKLLETPGGNVDPVEAKLHALLGDFDKRYRLSSLKTRLSTSTRKHKEGTSLEKFKVGAGGNRQETEI